MTLLLFGLGVVLSVAAYRHEKFVNYAGHGMAGLGCIAAMLCAFFVFMSGEVTLPLCQWVYVGTVTARLDYLAAYFLLLIGFIGTAASIYAMGYAREYYGRRLWLMAACFNAFLLSMVLVFTLSNVAAFIVAWEVMTIVSFLLVMQEWEQETNRRAAYTYLIMTHVGTAFIVSAFLMLAASTGSLDFASLQYVKVSEAIRNAVFLCALIGFGTKAGIIPLHAWLPKAHPAAPSHISALMSGVMIKSAIYGFIRFALDFLGPGPLWWGSLVMILAIVSCVLGVLYALMEHDIKRLLAYHSIENIGIILLGAGAGLIFMTQGEALLAGLAWAASLFHVLNHAIFKSLLFFGAGSVIQATHTKDIEKYGGLMKAMPYSALLFLIGAAAISALPPLNGFVSEWLTFQALFYLPHAINIVNGKLVSAVLIALLGLTGALAAACFVKAFGITFLAKPRSQHAAQAVEAPGVILLPMGGLAALCLGLGIYPKPVLQLLNLILAHYPGIRMADLFKSNWYGLYIQAGQTGSVMGVPGVLAILLAGAAGALILLYLNGKPRESVGETWTCGITPTARMEYTATGFSKPIRTAFRSILYPKREKLVDAADGGYYGHHLSYRLGISYIVDDLLYRPCKMGIIETAKLIKRVQSGNLQLYISYILAVTVLVLVLSSM